MGHEVKRRCGWCGDDPLYMDYHDNEWGKPITDENKLFELLILEGAQAGLSWITVLRKREAYRKAFDGFDPQKIALYGDKDIERLLANKGIIRNKGKISSAITNARLFLEIQKEFGSFRKYILGFFPEGKTQVNNPVTLADVPAKTDISDAISADMKRRGFKFFGSTICYAFLQSAGFVNNHITSCDFRH